MTPPPHSKAGQVRRRAAADMSDRPIIFSSPMVRALLDGRRTQTRRVLPSAHPRFPQCCNLRTNVLASEENAVWYWDDTHERVGASYRLPYATGDRLWVREAHALVPYTAYRLSDGVAQARDPSDPDTACVYKEGWERCKPGRWRPSIHMPRWASRLTLLVTDVRVQRVQEISEEDAEAEGCRPAFTDTGNPAAPVCSRPSYRWGFPELWNSIHGPDAWGRNDWVAAISFTVEHRNIDA